MSRFPADVLWGLLWYELYQVNSYMGQKTWQALWGALAGGPERPGELARRLPIVVTLYSQTKWIRSPMRGGHS